MTIGVLLGGLVKFVKNLFCILLVHTNPVVNKINGDFLYKTFKYDDKFWLI